jgi:predicted aldo/keto reductase-like oxidoreductase
MKTSSSIINQITPFVYGTTRLGDNSVPEEKRVRIARIAMDAGVWFHTSHHYNSALKILRTAFDQDPKNIPRLIIKLGGNTIEEFRKEIYKNTEPLGIESIDVGQLCIGGKLAEEFATGGNCYQEFQKIREEGLIKSFVMEVFPWNSEIPYQALLNGYSIDTVDAHIFYLNPLQRFANNKLWDFLQKNKAPIIAMRTISGGPIRMLRDLPGYAWKEYLQRRAVEVAPIFERSGIESWTEFCMRFAHSIPHVLATVGATSRRENLAEFISAGQNIKPLPPELVKEILVLHHRWSNELDIHAEPWTM